MHDLLQDMGREIVHKESPKEPGKRSRLWSNEDICNVLKKQKGTEAIEGIVIPYGGKLQDVRLNTKTFGRMHKLRFLNINDVCLTGNFEHIFEELRWLSGQKCHLKCLPSDFHPEKLVILDLQFSKIAILWHGILFLEQMKILNLNGCDNLTTTPDFIGVPNLEKLNLGNCKSLAAIHQSIGHLSRLACLDLSGCKILRCIPNIICNLRALESLNIMGFSNLEELPKELGNIESLSVLKADHTEFSKLPDSIGRLSRLVNLDLGFCKNLRTLPSSLCNLRVLENLCLTGCANLEELPEDLGNIESLRVLKVLGARISKLPDSIGRLSRLVKLDLAYCRNLRTLPSSLRNLRVLESLRLSDLEELSEELGNIESLRVLKVVGARISKLPDSIGRLSRLVNLDLTICKNLRTLPNSFCNLRVLKSLNLNNCDNLEELPEELGNIESLRELNVMKTAITKLPDSIERLTKLFRLNLGRCKKLKSFPSSICNLPLRELYASSCEIRVGNLLLDNIWSLSSLERLDLSSCEISDGNLLDNIGSLSSSLQVLTLSSNIFSILPSSLGQLSNLKKLTLDRCESLRSVQKLPPNLEELCAIGCTSIERLPNLSNLKHLETLHLLGCSRLVEIQGLEKLNSIKEIDLTDCNNLSITFKETFFKVYSGFGKEIVMYLPTADCPDWFSHQTKGTTICFDVPQNSENKFLGMILWEVSSHVLWTKAVVENKTNGNTWTSNYTHRRITNLGIDFHREKGPSVVRFVPKTQIAMKFGDKIEASIRGDDLTVERFGDKIEASIPRRNLTVKRFGVHLVYKTDTIEN